MKYTIIREDKEIDGFIRDRNIAKVARETEVSRLTVYRWLRGDSVASHEQYKKIKNMKKRVDK